MAEEKKKLSLADLGLEEDEDEKTTPTAKKPEEKKQESVKTTKKVNEDGSVVESMSFTDEQKKEIERLTEEQKAKEAEEAANKPAATVKGKKVRKSAVLKPTGENIDYDKKVNIEAIAAKKNPTKDPIRKTLDGLYGLADKGIEREKKELLSPHGRITEAKFKYIEEKYAILDSRAKNNDRLAKRIEAINNLIDTDARFDGISEHERKGYILFTVAHDEKTGVDNGYFGITSENGEYQPNPRLSSEVNKEIESLVMDEDATFDDMYTDEDTIEIGTNNSDSHIMPDIDKAHVKTDEDDDDIGLILEDEIEQNEDSDDDDEDEPTLSDDATKKILKEYKNELVDALHLNTSTGLEGFTIEDKPIKLNAALKENPVSNFSIVWPLQYAGTLVEMTPFSGDEIVLLSPNTTNFDTIAGLHTVFRTIYRHIINPNKPKYEIWLRQISDYDIDCLLFAVYVANFRDTNYITYECPNKKCRKVFLEKKDVMDMVNFPNDKVKNRFEAILKKDTVMSQMYKSSPRIINNNYAIGFVSQSIYSSLFEPAVLPKEFKDKHQSVIDIMPNIDKVYSVDMRNKTLTPISFGVDKSSFQKTVMRKARALDTIFKTFTPDERSIVIGEARKVSLAFDEDKITYSIPSTTCPKCKQEIKSTEANPLNLLFTRAQLPIVAASIPE